MINSPSDTRFQKVFSLIFGVAVILGVYRIYGYYLYDIPYGYDPGFFRHAIESSISALPGLPPTPSQNLPYHEPLFGLLGSVLVFSGLSVDTIIGPFLGFLSVFTALGVYFLGKQLHNRSVGLIAASIFLVSIIQYQEYWWNYWRNIVGIIFLLFSLGLFHRRSWLAVIPMAGVFTIHRPSALYFMIIVVIYLVVEIFTLRRIPWKKILLIFFAGCISLPLYYNQWGYLVDMIGPLSTTIGGTTSSGTFFNTRDFFFLIFPYFLIVVPAIFSKMEKKEFDIIFIGFLLGLIWSVLRLFFYNRMLVFFDIFTILMAAYGLVQVVGKWSPRIFWGVMILFFITQGYLYTSYAYEYSGRHTIKQEEFDIIRNLDILIPEGATILSTYRGYTPWILGYNTHHVLAPGLLDDQIWNESRWNYFYFQANDIERCQMIEEYRVIAPHLFVFVGDNQPELLLSSDCFQPLLSNTSHPIVYEVLYKK